LLIVGSGTQWPSSPLGLRRQLGFGLRAELLQVLALGLAALDVVGHQRVHVFLLEELGDALLHAALVLPAAIVLAQRHSWTAKKTSPHPAMPMNTQDRMVPMVSSKFMPAPLCQRCSPSRR
jgi:hypothetical protein